MVEISVDTFTAQDKFADRCHVGKACTIAQVCRSQARTLVILVTHARLHEYAYREREITRSTVKNDRFSWRQKDKDKRLINREKNDDTSDGGRNKMKRKKKECTGEKEKKIKRE